MTRRPEALHVGRSGEVAGGMSQVVNEYLSWDFPTYDQRFLPSRGANTIRTLPLFLRAAVRLATLRGTPRVVVVHLSQGGSFVREGMLVRLARARGIPVVAQLHGSRFVEFCTRRPRLVRRVLSKADAVTVLSDSARDAVLALVPDARVSLVPNAVAPVEPAAKRDLVVFGGAVTRRKGVDVLLTAWRELGAATEGWELVVAGPVREPDLLVDLPTRVSAPGAVPRAELRRLLAEAAIAVLPSRDEAMPLFVLEALAASAAVISTDVGGIAAVLDGAGVVIPPDDADSLRIALGSLLESSADREALGRAADARWRTSFSPDAIAPLLERVWDAARVR